MSEDHDAKAVDLEIAKSLRALNYEKSKTKAIKRITFTQFSLPLPLAVGWYAGINYCIDSSGTGTGPISAWMIVFLVIATVFVVANIFGGVYMLDAHRDRVFKANEEYLALMDRYGASLGS